MIYKFRRRGERQLAEPTPGVAPEGAVEVTGPPFPENADALTMEQFYEQQARRPNGHYVWIDHVPGYYDLAGDWHPPVIVRDWVLFPYDDKGRAWRVYRFGIKCPEHLVIGEPMEPARLGSEHPRGTL